MACGCGRRRRDTTAETPLILGSDQGEAVQVRAMVNLLGFQRGDTLWVRGSGVELYLARGFLQPV